MNQQLSNIQLPWPEWQIESELGRGSFGKVYRVYRSEFDTKIYAAVKVMQIPSDPAETEALEGSGIAARDYYASMVSSIGNEILLMQQLKGASHIIGIEDFKVEATPDQRSWTIYIRMELLQDLNKYRKNARMALEDIATLGIHICTALELCHSNNIIHRDIKPSNIFVSNLGEFKLGDFGISKHSNAASGGFATKTGTPNYMAPEVYHGLRYDFTVDFYSLGIVLFQLVNNGRLPFLAPAGPILPADAENAFIRRMNKEPLPAPVYYLTGESVKPGSEQLLNGLTQVILKACAPEPDRRYQSAGEMKKDLLTILQGKVIIQTSQSASMDLSATQGVRKPAPYGGNQSGNYGGNQPGNYGGNQSGNYGGNQPGNFTGRKKKNVVVPILGALGFFAIMSIAAVLVFTVVLPKLNESKADSQNSQTVTVAEPVPETEPETAAPASEPASAKTIPETSTPAAQPQTEASPATMTLYCCASEWASLRETASTDAYRLCKIPSREAVKYISDSGSFYYVEYDGQKGYVLKDYFSFDQSAPLNYGDGSAAVASTSAGTKIYCRASDWATLRASASKDSTGLAKIKCRESAELLGESGDFYYVSYNKTKGYVLKSYFSTDPNAELNYGTN